LPTVGNVDRADSPTTVIDVDDIDFTLSTLDHLDDQFADYGFIDPCPIPLLPEDDDNYLGNLRADVADVSIGRPSDEDPDTTFQPIGVLRDDAVALAQAIENTSPFARALHSFDAQILSLQTTRIAHYQHLRQVDAIIGSKTSICAHLDGGAMTSTTDLLKSLWHVTNVVRGSVVLAVADNRKHYPTKQGYLRVPTLSGDTLVPCYYTSTLPATIISPDAAGRALHCQGYTSVSSFDGSACNVTLRHCRRTAQDVELPATLQRGLLFTSAVIMPSRAERSSVRPPMKLQVSAIHFGQHRDVHSSTPESSACACDRPLESTAPVADTPTDDDCVDDPKPLSGPDLRHKVLHYQRMGFQADVSIDTLYDTTTVDTGIFPGIFDDVAACGECDPAAACSCVVPPNPPVCVCPTPKRDSTLPPAVDSPAVRKISFDVSTPPTYTLSHLSRDQQRILWHQRLGHLHSRRVSEAHKFARGIPPVPIAGDLDKCPVCLHAKLRKAAASKVDSRRATQCNQGISVDFGFLVQGSKDSTRKRRLAGINGETCYCLIVDHYSGTLYGETFRTKAPPTDYINRWLAQHAPARDDVADRYVRFDLGGELGHSPAVVKLFEDAGYSVEPTAPDSSHQNAPGERPHQTIGDALRAMLGGADLPAHFWPYAFHHHLRLYNVTVHGDKLKSPFEICRGTKPLLSYLRTFGCRVYALPARPRRPDKALSDARTGIFLGFAKTTKNILYYDLKTNVVKTAQHAVFDEAMADVPIEKRSFNARLLNAGGDVGSIDLVDVAEIYPDLDVSRSPFTGFNTLTFPLDITSDEPFGFVLAECSRLKRGFVESFSAPAVGKTLKATRKAFTHSYIVSVNGLPVFSLDDVDAVFDSIASSNTTPSTVEIVLAPERKADFDDRPSPLHLRISDLRRVHALQHAAPDLPCNLRVAVAELYDDLDDPTVSEIMSQVQHSICKLQTDAMTDEERKLTSFSRGRLKKLSNWSDWDAAHDDQLDNHFESGTIVKAVLRPVPVSGRPPNVLRVHWANAVKTDGRRKSRACLDGSKSSAPWLRDVAQTYASCIEQPCMRLFFALSAIHGCTVTIADTKNAFQQSPPPTEDCFLQIDEAIHSWYLKRFGISLNARTHVIPVKKALQGHPEAGYLWETMIDSILKEFGFNNTTHERNLYRGEIDGAMVLVCRQVDDFAIASVDPSHASKLVAMINAKVTTVDKGIGDITLKGAFSQYNGVDIHQTRDYVKLSCESYIDRVLQTHGWATPDHQTSDRHDHVPLSPSLVTSLGTSKGPAEGTSEYRSIAEVAGFSYRQILGELIYAYVVGRLDIGYAVTFLARFSQHPTAAHYTALKSVVKYLRRTKSWGLLYWRPAPLAHLPRVPTEQPSLDSHLPPFPDHPLSELVGYVDAAHATDLVTRRSITGLVFTLAGGAVAFKSKVQPTVSTSSTEAELIAAVTAAKLAKYIRSILIELGFPPPAPTVLYEDNEATMAMINENRPTPRARHVDIQFFAIQEWRQQGHLIVRRIPTTINIADGGTKALGWTLHSRHARRAMGHFSPTMS
jgi:hypothetical protein